MLACKVIGKMCPACGGERLTQAEVWQCSSGALFLSSGQNPLPRREMTQSTQVLLLINFFHCELLVTSAVKLVDEFPV